MKKKDIRHTLKLDPDQFKKLESVMKKCRWSQKVAMEVAVDALWEETFRGKGRVE